MGGEFCLLSGSEGFSCYRLIDVIVVYFVMFLISRSISYGILKRSDNLDDYDVN